MSPNQRSRRVSIGGSVAAAIVVVSMLFTPHAYAKDASVRFKIVAPDCKVTQVEENGTMKDVFTPKGCDTPPKATNPGAAGGTTSPASSVQQPSQSSVQKFPQIRQVFGPLSLSNPRTPNATVPNNHYDSSTSTEPATQSSTAVVVFGTIIVAGLGVWAVMRWRRLRQSK